MVFIAHVEQKDTQKPHNSLLGIGNLSNKLQNPLGIVGNLSCHFRHHRQGLQSMSIALRPFRSLSCSLHSPRLSNTHSAQHYY